MTAIITASIAGDLEFNALPLTFEIPNTQGQFDLFEAIKESCVDYVRTDEGRKVYEACGEKFTWQEFCDCVPDEICRKHGFSKENPVVDYGNVHLEETLI